MDLYYKFLTNFDLRHATWSKLIKFIFLTLLDHDEIILDQTIVDETTNGIDRFVSNILGSSSVVTDLFTIDGVITGSDTVNLFVDFGTVVVSLLTRSGN